MKAVVQERYGTIDALLVRDIEVPVAKDDEVLVRVRAASVHPDVWHVVVGRPFVLRIMGAGLARPKKKIPGTDVSGVVEAVGKDVTRFRPGDEVFGETIRGIQWVNGGAFAEYAAAPEEGLALKPPNITFEEAAAVPTSGLIALQSVRTDARVRAGQRVLINGAAGGVGIFAVQIAKALGATVTGVDRGEKLEMVKSIGADHVIDYTQQDFTQATARYDVIVDIPGNHSFFRCRRALSPTGRYVLVGHDQYGANGRRVFGSLPRFLKLVILKPMVGNLPDFTFTSPPKAASMDVLRDFLESGKIRPVVGRAFPLSSVRDAMRYLVAGQGYGKIVLRM